MSKKFTILVTSDVPLCVQVRPPESRPSPSWSLNQVVSDLYKIRDVPKVVPTKTDDIKQATSKIISEHDANVVKTSGSSILNNWGLVDKNVKRSQNIESNNINDSENSQVEKQDLEPDKELLASEIFEEEHPTNKDADLPNPHVVEVVPHRSFESSLETNLTVIEPGRLACVFVVYKKSYQGLELCFFKGKDKSDIVEKLELAEIFTKTYPDGYATFGKSGELIKSNVKAYVFIRLNLDHSRVGRDELLHLIRVASMPVKPPLKESPYRHLAEKIMMEYKPSLTNPNIKKSTAVVQRQAPQCWAIPENEDVDSLLESSSDRSIVELQDQMNFEQFQTEAKVKIANISESSASNSTAMSNTTRDTLRTWIYQHSGRSNQFVEALAKLYSAGESFVNNGWSVNDWKSVINIEVASKYEHENPYASSSQLINDRYEYQAIENNMYSGARNMKTKVVAQEPLLGEALYFSSGVDSLLFLVASRQDGTKYKLEQIDWLLDIYKSDGGKLLIDIFGLRDNSKNVLLATTGSAKTQGSCKVIAMALVEELNLSRPSDLTTFTESGHRGLNSDLRLFMQMISKFSHEAFTRLLIRIFVECINNKEQAAFGFCIEESINTKVLYNDSLNLLYRAFIFFCKNALKFFDSSTFDSYLQNYCLQTLNIIWPEKHNNIKSFTIEIIRQNNQDGRVDDNNPQLYRLLLQSKIVNLGTKVTNIIRDHMFMFVLYPGSPSFQVLKELFSAWNPFPCTVQDHQVTADKLIERLRDYSVINFHDMPYNRSVETYVQHYLTYEPLDIDRIPDAEQSTAVDQFRRVCELVSIYIRRFARQLPRMQYDAIRSIPVVYLEESVRAVVDMLMKQIREKRITEIDLYSSQDVLDQLDKFTDRPEEFRQIILTAKRDVDKISGVISNAKYVTNTPKLINLRSFAFHRPTVDNIKRLDDLKVSRNLRELLESTEYQLLSKLDFRAVMLYEELEEHKIFKDKVREYENNTVEEFSINILAIVKGFKEKYTYLYTQKDKDEGHLKLKDLYVEFPDASNKEKCRHLLTVLQLDNECIDYILDVLQGLCGYSKLLSALKEGTFERLFDNLERITKFRESSILFNRLTELKQTLIDNNKLYDPEFSSKDLQDLDYYRVSWLAWTMTYEHRLIKTLALKDKGDQLFDFVNDNIREFLRKLINECNNNYNIINNDLNTIVQHLEFINTFDGGDILERLLTISNKFQVDVYYALEAQIHNVSRLKSLKNQIEGRFAELMEEMLRESIFIMEFSTVKNEFVWKVYINPDASKLISSNQVLPTRYESYQLEGYFDRSIFQLTESKKTKPTQTVNASNADQAREKEETSEYKKTILSQTIKKTGADQAREMEESNRNPDDQSNESIEIDGNKTDDVEDRNILLKRFNKLSRRCIGIRKTMNLLRKLGGVGKDIDSYLETYLKYTCRSVSEELQPTTTGKRAQLCFRIKNKNIRALGLVNKDLKLLYAQRHKDFLQVIQKHSEGNQLVALFAGHRLWYLIEALLKDDKGDRSLEYNDIQTLIDRMHSKYDIQGVREKIKGDIPREGSLGILASFYSKLFQNLPAYLNSFEISPVKVKGMQFSTKNRVSTIDISVPKPIITNPYDTMLKCLISNNEQNNEEMQRLELTDILHCSQNTNENEIEGFLTRCFNSLSERTCFLLNPAKLSKSTLNRLVEMISSASDEKARRQLIIFDNIPDEDVLKNTKLFENVDSDVEAFLSELNKNRNMITERYYPFLKSTTIVNSKHAGDGKSHYIKKQANGTTICELSLSGQINERIIADRLAALSKSTQDGNHFVLHIKIDYFEDFDEQCAMVDWILFNLCFFHAHYSETGLHSYKDKIKHVYIELGNSFSLEKMKESFKTIELLYQPEWNQYNDRKITLNTTIDPFNQRAIEYDANMNSDWQVAARHIKDAREFRVPNLDVPNSEVISVNEYRELLWDEFPSKGGEVKRTYSNFKFWVTIIAVFRRDLQKWYSKNIELNKIDKKDKKVKSFLIETSREITKIAANLSELQNPGGLITKCQDQVMALIKEQSEEQKVRLKMKINELVHEASWNTKKIYMPIMRQNDFIPICHTTDILTEGRELTISEQKNIEASQAEPEHVCHRLETRSKLRDLEDAYLKMDGKKASRERNLFYNLLSMVGKKKIESKDIDFIISSDDPRNEAITIEEGIYVKLALMVFKASIRAPIIIMGESGCGKTFLIKTLVTRILNSTGEELNSDDAKRNDELMMETLHSGYPEKRLIIFILMAIKRATQIKPKRLWVFFDEFNTTALQSMIADVMLDRTVPQLGIISDEELKANKVDDKADNLTHEDIIKYVTIPDNVVFAACCNPYRTKMNEPEEDAYLIPNMKTSNLSHIVHPIPKRLLEHIFDFGQLTSEEEKIHFRQKTKHKINSDTLESIKDPDLAALFHACHTVVRNIEERSGVSFRDMDRVCEFYEWFVNQFSNINKHSAKNKGAKDEDLQNQQFEKENNQHLWMFESRRNQEIAAAVCTATLCYALRLNTQEKAQSELFQRITDWVNSRMGLGKLRKQQVVATFCALSQLFLDNANIRQKDQYKDIAYNKPFLENFLTLLACFSKRIPLIIIGAPGTSKTLSANILIDLLSQTKDQTFLFQGFGQATPIYYSGSQNSTADEVRNLFETAKSNDIVQGTKIIFFDELGQAETSPHNPLKVMHAYLERNVGEIMFVGISNWKLDQSKLNRMVCLTRPDLQKDDIEKIFAAILKGFIKGTSLSQILEALQKTYLNFRKWQKFIHKKCAFYHPNFHGSRDLYGTSNYLSRKTKENKVKLDSKDDKIRFGEVYVILKDGIERNFNGEIYWFSGPQGSQGLKDEYLKTMTVGSEKEEFMTSEFFAQTIENPNFIDRFKASRYSELENMYSHNNSPNEESRRQDERFSMTSAEVFKLFLVNKIYDQFTKGTDHLTLIKDKDINKLANENIQDMQNSKTSGERSSRFMMIRSEGRLVEDLFFQTLKEHVKNKLVDWRTLKHESNAESLLAKFKEYVTEGFTVVMKNLDIIYDALFELFNQKYQKNSSDNYYCFVYHGQTKQPVQVHKEFNCIIIASVCSNAKDSADFETKQPAPFLNRFEKYFLQLSTIVDSNIMDKISESKSVAMKLHSGNMMRTLALNIDMNASMLLAEVDLTKKSYTYDFQRFEQKLFHLSTISTIFNKLLSQEQKQKFIKAKELTFRHLLDLKGPSKTIVLTFSMPTAAKNCPWNTYAYYAVKASDLKFEDQSLKGYDISQNTSGIIILFESRNDIGYLYRLRNYFDQNHSNANVIFLVYLSNYKSDLKFLQENVGINFWNSWNVETIEKLGLKEEESLKCVFNMRDQTMRHALFEVGKEYPLNLLCHAATMSLLTDYASHSVKVEPSQKEGMVIDMRGLHKALKSDSEDTHDALRLIIKGAGQAMDKLDQTNIIDVFQAVAVHATDRGEEVYEPVEQTFCRAVKKYYSQELKLNYFRLLNVYSNGLYARLFSIAQGRNVKSNIELLDAGIKATVDLIKKNKEATPARTKKSNENIAIAAGKPPLMFYSPLTDKMIDELVRLVREVVNEFRNSMFNQSAFAQLSYESASKSQQIVEQEKDLVDFAQTIEKRIVEKSQRASSSDWNDVKELLVSNEFLIDLLRLINFLYDEQANMPTGPRIKHLSYQFDQLDAFLMFCNNTVANINQSKSEFVSKFVVPFTVCFCFGATAKCLLEYKDLDKLSRADNKESKMLMSYASLVDWQQKFESGGMQETQTYMIIEKMIKLLQDQRYVDDSTYIKDLRNYQRVTKREMLYYGLTVLDNINMRQSSEKVLGDKTPSDKTPNYNGNLYLYVGEFLKEYIHTHCDFTKLDRSFNSKLLKCFTDKEKALIAQEVCKSYFLEMKYKPDAPNDLLNQPDDPRIKFLEEKIKLDNLFYRSVHHCLISNACLKTKPDSANSKAADDRESQEFEDHEESSSIAMLKEAVLSLSDNRKTAIASACFWTNLCSVQTTSIISEYLDETFGGLDVVDFATKPTVQSFLLVCLLRKIYQKEKSLERFKLCKGNVGSKVVWPLIEKLRLNEAYTSTASKHSLYFARRHAVVKRDADALYEAIKSKEEEALPAVFEGSEVPKRSYELGLAIIELILHDSSTDEIKAKLLSIVDDTSASKFAVKLCKFALSLIELKSAQYDKCLVGGKNGGSDELFRLVIAHFALIVLVFGEQEMNRDKGFEYNGKEWKNWKNSITQTSFACATNTDIRECLAHKARAFEACFDWQVYMCSQCGAKVALPAGEESMTAECPLECAIVAFNADPNSSTPEKKSLAESKYVPHADSSEDSVVYRNWLYSREPDRRKATPSKKFDYEAFRNDCYKKFYVRHLLDHLYLLSTPLLVDDAGYSELKEKLLNGGEWTGNVDYENKPVDLKESCIKHVDFDLKQLSMLTEAEGLTDRLHWLNYYIETIAQDILDSKPIQLECKPIPTSEPMQAIRDFITGVSRGDSMFEKNNDSKLNLLLKLRPNFVGKANAKAHFKQCVNSPQYDLKLLWHCTRYVELLKAFPDMMNSLVSLMQHFKLRYWKKISLKEAASKKLSDLMKSDKCLRTLFEGLVKHWKFDDDVDHYHNKYPEIFDYKHLEKLGYRPEQLLAEATDEYTATVLHFIIVDDRDKTELNAPNVVNMFKHLLELLIHRFNNVILSCTHRVGDDVTTTESNILLANKQDFVALDANFDLYALVDEHQMLDPRSKQNPILIDFKKIELLCSNQILYKKKDDKSMEKRMLLKIGEDACFKFREYFSREIVQPLPDQLNERGIQNANLISQIMMEKNKSTEEEIMDIVRTIEELNDLLTTGEADIDYNADRNILALIDDQAEDSENSDKFEKCKEKAEKYNLYLDELRLNDLTTLVELLNQKKFDIWLGRQSQEISKSHLDEVKAVIRDKPQLVNNMLEELDVILKDKCKNDEDLEKDSLSKVLGNKSGDVHQTRNDFLSLNFAQILTLRNYKQLRSLTASS